MLENTGGILSPRDIYNFYFLWTIQSYHPELLRTDYGKFIKDEYLNNFKAKYMAIFKRLLFEQIKKYVSRGRIDPDFPVDKLTPEASATELQALMQKTFRSDMKRRNDVWNMAAEFLTNLEKAKDKDIFLWINQLNNAVHNTNTQILGKVSHDLVHAYDMTDKAHSYKDYQQFVDKDLRQLLSQETELQESNTVQIHKVDRNNPDFMKGLTQGAIDKRDNGNTDLKDKSEDFKRGYLTAKPPVRKDSWYDRMNNKVTGWLADLGNSRSNSMLK